MAYADVILADRPSAWFRLGETSGTAAVDAIGGASGAYVGDFALAQPGLILDANGCARFNGSTYSGYVRVADRTALDMGSVGSMEAWVYLERTGSGSDVTSAIVDKGSGSLIVRTVSASDTRLLVRRNGVSNIVTSRVAVALRTRTHVVVTWSGSTWAIYINGVDQTGTVTHSALANTALPLCIGAADGGSNDRWAGYIDEVALYPAALLLAQVQAHYLAGRTLTLGAATEASSAPALKVSRTRNVGLATEVDSAPGVTVSKRRIVGLATSTDAALRLTVRKTRTLGLAAETSLALPVTLTRRITLGLATEASTAPGVVVITAAPPPTVRPPTRLQLDPYATTLTIASRATFLAIDPAVTVVSIDDRLTEVALDA